MDKNNLYTTVEEPAGLPRLAHSSRLMLLGSCFATEMGQRLQEGKFTSLVNPFGTLYNPLSISAALRRIAAGRSYGPEELFRFRDCWHSPMHHGEFSSPVAEETLVRINGRLNEAHAALKQLDCLLLTFGTAWVYEDRATGRVVANCHKQPEACFTRRLLSVEEIVDDYTALLADLLAGNPGLRVVLTVSPIRHVRDGLHANQLSKATLLLAVERLQAALPEHVAYFPAYELLTDELRDYRFYAEDLVHPSTTAVDYVWERFVQWMVEAEALPIMTECKNICKMLAHKPFRPSSEEYKRFLGQIVLKIERLKEKYPYLDFQNERELCRIRLKA